MVTSVRNSIRFTLLGIAAGLLTPLGVVLYSLNTDTPADGIELFVATAASAVVTLGIAGWIVGRKDDRLAEQNRALRAMTERLAAISTTDGLTGVPNRRALDQRLEDELARSNRYGTQLAVVIMDLDRFKRLNDHHGHMAGDAVLRQVATILDQEKRRGDFVSRYGGEEFVALLPHADGNAAFAWAERVRARIEASAIETATALVQVTASFGVASTAPGRSGRGSAAELLGAADRALYAAKTNGRNRVESADPTSPSSSTYKAVG